MGSWGTTAPGVASLADALLACHAKERSRDKPKERLQGRLHPGKTILITWDALDPKLFVRKKQSK